MSRKDQPKPLRLDRSDLFRSPASFLALGFGSGLAPVAPGTAGTLVGVGLCAVLGFLPTTMYIVLTVLISLIGITICQSASDELGVHDHGGIVWDEIAGFLVTMIAVPVSFATLVAGFILFRLFDIWKPWPIGWLDKRVEGGLGIMIDDIVAGAFACVLLHMMLLAVPVFFPAFGGS